MKPLYLLVLISLLASPALLTAQVVARQGTPAESPLQEFKSPMVLDLPIKDFKDLPPDTGREFKEVRKYYCDERSALHRGPSPRLSRQTPGICRFATVPGKAILDISQGFTVYSLL
jgi:hypothetical protein